MKTPPVRALASAGALILIALASLSSADEPDDVFAGATVLAPDIRSVRDAIGPDELEFPDTVLGVFDEFGTLLVDDDDSSELGDGFASGVFLEPVNADGSIRLKVSGFPDFDFIGDHEEGGGIEVVVDIVVPLDESDPDFGTDFEDFFDFEFADLLPGEVLEFVFQDPDWIGLQFIVDIDNEIGPVEIDDFRDFFRFTGLTPGAEFFAEVTDATADFDSILAQFDESGEIIVLNDDLNDDTFLSGLRGVVPASGEVVLAVTGFDDFDFDASHNELALYSLVVTEIPEPTAVMLGLIATACFVPRRRA